MLCMDDPTSDAEPEGVFKIIDEFFLWFYLAECILKILAMGFVFSRNAYLKDGWNVLDFIIVVTSILPKLQGNSGGSSSFASLRSLRVLRPLRTISSVKALKVIIITLFAAIP